MSKVIICVGISGSGKTTWATNYIKNNPRCLRINRDDIRRCLVGDLTGYYQRRDIQHIEELVTSISWATLALLDRKDENVNIIIDNTHLNRQWIKDLIEKLEFRGDKVQIKLFDCDKVLAKDRVLFRDNLKESEVNYIEKHAQQYEEIKKWLIEEHKEKIIE